jgi:crotonobetainyl-CoA:carnitine CoA-transferase CaiB-like acyl-CoA transferase
MLDGIRIVSFNHFLMGPFGIQHLADLGADVIAVEPVGGAWQRKWGGGNRSVDGQTVLFLAANRNKRSVALNLKSPEGQEIARKLVAGADVVSENYRPGVMKAFGLDYESVRALNPNVVYASASGFGQSGPYVDRPGQDLLIQAMSGVAAITGTEDGARTVGVSAIDHHGAALLAMGILAALMRRERSGQGCHVDVSLLGAAIDLQMESFTCYMNGEKPESIRQPKHVGGWYYGSPYGIYRALDGEMVISLTPLPLLGKVLEIPELETMNAGDAFSKREEVATMVQARVGERSRAHWFDVFAKNEVWHAPVNDYEAVFADPQVRHNESFMTVPGATGSDVKLVRHPVRYDGKGRDVTLVPQPLGAQTDDVLRELGYKDADIARLAESGVVQRAKA